MSSKLSFCSFRRTLTHEATTRPNTTELIAANVRFISAVTLTNPIGSALKDDDRKASKTPEPFAG